MECNSSTCSSGCYKDSDSGVGQERQSASENGRCDLDLYANSHVCIKCKVNETIAATHPAVASGGGDGSRFCADCFRGNLFGKFRFAVTSNAMISPSDNVLIAFSGGSSSRSIFLFSIMIVCAVVCVYNFWHVLTVMYGAIRICLA